MSYSVAKLYVYWSWSVVSWR